MKKKILYILILIALLGFFSPVYKTQAQTTTSSGYQLLAPLPCDSGPGCVNGQLTTFDPTNQNGENSKIGEYLNLMIKIFIGICAVLAVIMIVWGGIEYMTSELISGKEGGKERITQAILGLILALGAYLILYTINPNILNTDLKSLTSQAVNIALSEAIQSDSGKIIPTGPIVGCTAGMQKTTSGMFACGDGNLAQNINNMTNFATQSGINITGGGYRSSDEQKALRIRNCNGDYTNANAQCNPPTALPGLSNHNNGKAFDLKCDGVIIQTSDNKCFIWLKNNAAKYGLQNLANGSEPWHWSVDGR